MSTSGNTADAQSALSPYQMHIIIEPPDEARPGDALLPAPTIQLRFRENVEEEAALAQDISSYWAVASLVSDDGMVALAPPSTSLVSGTPAGAIQEPDGAEADGEVGYVLFRNLCINQPGNFRLRISLYRMATAESDASGAAAALNTGSVTTRVIHIHHGAQVARLRPEERNILTSLQRRGIIRASSSTSSGTSEKEDDEA
ncbi:MAG: hypothetical protein Q9173_003988 [Seirophora scorigena]